MHDVSVAVRRQIVCNLWVCDHDCVVRLSLRVSAVLPELRTNVDC